MTLFNTELVDIPTQERIINILLKYRSYDVLINLLDSVTIKLLIYSYPAEAYKWLTGNPPPKDFLIYPALHLDPRGTVIYLWKQLAKELSTDDHRERLSDGVENLSWNKNNEGVADKIVKSLTSFPFEQAISTWLAVWKEWIQISNVDELMRNINQSQAKEDGNNLPRRMADWVEYQYILGGW